MGINTKSLDNTFNLDEDLDLFSDTEWNFFEVTDNDLNSEYFCDIEEVNFLDKHIRLRLFLPYFLLAFLISFGGIWLINIIMHRKDNAYENYKASIDSNVVSYIDGEEGSSEDYINISKTLQDYCNVLAQGSNYKDLDKYCITTSVFNSTYEDYRNRMQSNYDTYDNFSRSMRLFGSCIKSNRVDKVIVKDDTYYAYVRLTYPTKESVREYVNLHKYNAVKNFNGLEISESELSRFLLDTLETNQIACNEEVVTLEFMKQGGMKLVSDNDILYMCNTAYSYAIGQLSNAISNTTNIKN